MKKFKFDLFSRSLFIQVRNKICYVISNLKGENTYETIC